MFITFFQDILKCVNNKLILNYALLKALQEINDIKDAISSNLPVKQINVTIWNSSNNCNLPLKKKTY